MTDFVDVIDEPRHRHRIENQFARIYDVLIPSGDTTLYHRHTEDTLYVSIAPVHVRDQTWGHDEAQEAQLPAGAALCRNHREEPLIHQVSNIGANDMRMVGIEVKATPPLTQPEALSADCHQLIWSRERIRAYQLDISAGETIRDLRYDFFGATIFLEPCCLEIADSPGVTRSVIFSAGDVAWHEGPVHHTLTNIGPMDCKAIVAEWC